MGVDGIGWGTGVATDKVWITSFNGKIGVMDFDGKAIGKESDFPTAGKNGGLQGIGIAPNGDVWIADAVKDQLLYFPGGWMKDGRIVPVKGLVSPFSIAIDAQNRVWVGNALSNTIIRFPAEDPSKAEEINAGGSASAVSLWTPRGLGGKPDGFGLPASGHPPWLRNHDAVSNRRAGHFWLHHSHKTHRRDPTDPPRWLPSSTGWFQRFADQRAVWPLH
jgi:hypothetical protein